jgi:selenocysteine-specific elongation factor
LRLHIATSEVLTELRLADKPQADAVSNVFAQLKTAEPIVATWGQCFILRDESGMRTLGGGRVLRPVGRLWTARRPIHRAGLQALLEGQPAARLEEVIRAAEWQPLDDKHLSVRAGLRDELEAAELSRRLMGGGKIRLIEAASLRLHVHNSHLQALADDLDRRLMAFIQANPRLPGLARAQAPAWMPGSCPPRLRQALAEWWVSHGPVALEHDHIVSAGKRRELPPADQTLLDALLKEFELAAFQPPLIAELKCRTPRNEKRVRELVDLAVAQGKLVRFAPDMWLHERRWKELVECVTGAIRQRGGVTVADIRTLLNSSRKYVVPIAEALDAAGITRRAGDLRQLGPKSGLPT